MNREFEFPTEIYPPMLIGKLIKKTNLEELLERIDLQFEEYICKIDVIKTSSSKKGAAKQCQLILATKNMITIEERENGPKIHRYPYMDVESCNATVQTIGNKQIRNKFQLNFYVKEMDLKKEAKKVVFQCRESKTGQSFDSALFSALHVI